MVSLPLQIAIPETPIWRKSMVLIISGSDGPDSLAISHFAKSGFLMSSDFVISKSDPRCRCAPFHALALLAIAPGPPDHYSVTTTLPRRGYGVCDASMHTTAGFSIVQIPMLRYTDNWPPLIGVSLIAISQCINHLAPGSPILR
jgi:hypothetical protein